MKLNENIAYAKSILNKNGISKDSDEYNDYLRIREICGRNNGYVGILTKLRFIDGVSKKPFEINIQIDTDDKLKDMIKVLQFLEDNKNYIKQTI